MSDDAGGKKRIYTWAIVVLVILALYPIWKLGVIWMYYFVQAFMQNV